MRLYKETTIRKQADEPTIKMLDLWHSLTKQKMDTKIEVMVGDRREHPQLGSFLGEMHTASPCIVENKVVLAVWLDTLTNVNSIILTHEIGHWVLKLQGFHGLIYRPDPHCNMEILLNSLVQHPPLYALQRSLEHEPQIEIDSRANHDIGLFGLREPNERNSQVNNALLLADDLMNCSKNNCEKLMEIIGAKHPSTNRFIEKILFAAVHYNILDAQQNLRFS